MFNAANGQQASDARIEEMSDQLAADAVSFLQNPSIPRAHKEAAMAAAAAIFADPGQLSQLAQGTYAQNSAGQPAAALGTGDSSHANAQEGLRAIMSDDAIDPGIKLALTRLLTPADPDHIPVGRDGTPSELVAARRERDMARTDRDAARVELTKEHDATTAGSLANRLATAIAERDAAQATVGGYDQASARAAAQAVLDALNAQRGKMGGDVVGRDDVKAKLTAFANAVSLRAAP